MGSYKGPYRGNYFYDLELIGDTAYLTDNYGAVAVDVSDPRRPREVVRIDAGGACFAVTASEGYMYLGGGRGLMVVDISDPDSPRTVGDHDLAAEAYDLLVLASRLLIADNAGGLVIVDISDPQNLVEVSRLDTQGPCRGLSAAGATLYASDVGQGVLIVDIADMALPQLTGTIADTEGACGLKAAGELLQVHFHGEGVKLYDISEPELPALLGSIDPEWASNTYTPASPSPLPSEDSSAPALIEPYAGSGHLMAVRNGLRGVSVWDLADQSEPRLIGYYPTRGGSHGLHCRGDYVFSAMDRLIILTPAP